MAEPRVAITPPVIRRFHLLAISERLAEQAVLVVQAVAGRRLSHGGHRIKETCRQTTEAAVAQARVDFLFQQVGQVNVMRLKLIADLLIPAEVEQVVAGQATNQKLHGDIVYVALSFGRFHYRLSRQQLGQRAAYGAPPLTLGHLGSGL